MNRRRARWLPDAAQRNRGLTVADIQPESMGVKLMDFHLGVDPRMVEATVDTKICYGYLSKIFGEVS